MKLRNLWLGVLMSGLAFAGYSRAATPNPGIALQGPDHYSFTVGHVKITALSDGTVPQDFHVLLRNTTDEKTDALLKASFLSNPVEASINAFFFRDGDKLVLVDITAPSSRYPTSLFPASDTSGAWEATLSGYRSLTTTGTRPPQRSLPIPTKTETGRNESSRR